MKKSSKFAIKMILKEVTRKKLICKDDVQEFLALLESCPIQSAYPITPITPNKLGTAIAK